MKQGRAGRASGVKKNQMKNEKIDATDWVKSLEIKNEAKANGNGESKIIERKLSLKKLKNIFYFILI